MARVDSTLATALQRESTTATAAPASAVRWPDQGRTIETLSPFASEAGGAAEASRLAALFDGPTVRDRVAVPGRVRGITKRCIRLKAAGLDYPPEGALVIVLGAAEQENGTTVLTVLRKLA